MLRLYLRFIIKKKKKSLRLGNNQLKRQTRTVISVFNHFQVVIN